MDLLTSLTKLPIDLLTIRNNESNYINNPNIYNSHNHLWDIYKHKNIFIYLDEDSKIQHIYNLINEKLKCNFILMGPYIRSIFASDKTNLNMSIDLFLLEHKNINEQIYLLPNKLQIDNITINVIKKIYKTTEYIILKHKNWYDRIAFNGTCFIASSSFIAEYTTSKKYISNFDPIINKRIDPLYIYYKKYDIFDMIDQYDINRILKIERLQYEILQNNYTPIEHAINNYFREDNNNLKSIIKDIIIILSKYEYKRHPYIYFVLKYNKSNELLNIIMNIKSKYNIEHDISIKTESEIDTNIINYFIKHDRHEHLLDYLQTYKYNITQVELDNIITYNSRKILEFLIIGRIINFNDAFYCIVLTEALNLLELLKFDNDTIVTRGKLLLDKIISSDKVLSLFYLYKLDENIINYKFLGNSIIYLIGNNSTKTIKFITKIKPELLTIDSIFTHIDKNINILISLTPYIKNNYNTVDINGNTLLHLIIKNNRLDYLNYLLHYPEYKTMLENMINKQNKNGDTALILSAKTLITDLYYSILALEPDVNIVDIHGNTVYHYICMNNLCQGISIPNKPNNYGMRPSDYSNIKIEYWKFY